MLPISRIELVDLLETLKFQRSLEFYLIACKTNEIQF